jgi:hypothetical protein
MLLSFANLTEFDWHVGPMERWVVGDADIQKNESHFLVVPITGTFRLHVKCDYSGIF